MMKAELLEQFVREIESWEASQKNQKDGYEYERSFVEMWRKLGREVLEGSLGDLPKSRNEKKNKNDFWVVGISQDSCFE